MMQEITKREYESLGGIHHMYGGISPTTETAWFKQDDLLGIVLLDRIDNDWSYVTLAKHPDRGWKYRCMDVKTSMPSFDAAKAALAASMRKYSSPWQRWLDSLQPDPE